MKQKKKSAKFYCSFTLFLLVFMIISQAVMANEMHLTQIGINASTNIKSGTLKATKTASFGNNTYSRFDPEDISWEAANQYCNELGGHLVVITSSQENAFVKSLLERAPLQAYWLGGKVNGSSFSWITGEAGNYSDFHPHEPNGAVYMQMLLDGHWAWDDTWNDGDIGGGVKQQGFICEWENDNDLSKATISLSSKTYTYNGKSKKPTVTVKYNGKTLTANTDYKVSYKNNKEAGKAEVTVKGKGKYKGSQTKTFTIKPLSIKNAKTTVKTKKIVYTGKAITLSFTITLNNVTLKKGTDYTVSYSNNINPGNATVTVTGKGNYTDSIKWKFTIPEDEKVAKMLKMIEEVKKAYKDVPQAMLDYTKRTFGLYQEAEDGIKQKVKDKIETVITFDPNMKDEKIKKAYLDMYYSKIDAITTNISSYSKVKTAADLVNKINQDLLTDDGKCSFKVGKTKYTVTYDTTAIWGASWNRGTIKNESTNRSYVFSITTVNTKSINTEMGYLKEFAQLKIDEAAKAAITDAGSILNISELKSFLKKATKSSTLKMIKSVNKTAGLQVEKLSTAVDKYSKAKSAYDDIVKFNVKSTDYDKLVSKIAGFNKKLETWQTAIDGLIK